MNVVDGSVIVMRAKLVYAVVMTWSEVGYVAWLELDSDANEAEDDWDPYIGRLPGAVGVGVDCEAGPNPDGSIELSLLVVGGQLVDVNLGKSLKP